MKGAREPYARGAAVELKVGDVVCLKSGGPGPMLAMLGIGIGFFFGSFKGAALGLAIGAIFCAVWAGIARG